MVSRLFPDAAPAPDSVETAKSPASIKAKVSWEIHRAVGPVIVRVVVVTVVVLVWTGSALI